MSKDTIVNEMRANLAREREGLALVRNTARGAFRVFETVGVVGRQGLGWLLGDREALPRHLRRTFESLGATYIKLGQFIASSPSPSSSASLKSVNGIGGSSSSATSTSFGTHDLRLPTVSSSSATLSMIFSER